MHPLAPIEQVKAEVEDAVEYADNSPKPVRCCWTGFHVVHLSAICQPGSARVSLPSLLCPVLRLAPTVCPASASVHRRPCIIRPPPHACCPIPWRHVRPRLTGNLLCLPQDMSQLLENVFADPKGFGIGPDGRYRYEHPGFTAGTAEVS